MPRTKETLMSDKKVFNYPGASADVHWDGRLCIHIGECGRANNDLFVGGRQPWCQPDDVSPDERALDDLRTSRTSDGGKTRKFT